MSKNIKTKTVTEGSFLGITPPQYEFFKVELFHTNYNEATPVTKKVVKNDDNFTIRIHTTEVGSNRYKEISTNLSDMVKPSFVKFNYDIKAYEYYTGRWTGDTDAKKRNLTNLLDYLSEFEQDYKKEFSIATQKFQEAKEQKQSYVDSQIAVKYSEELKAFVVLGLNYMGPEKFKILASSSQNKGKLGDFTQGVTYSPVGQPINVPALDEKFFDDLVPFKAIHLRKSLFIIKAVNYNEIKSLIETQIDEKKEFVNSQKPFIEEYLKEPFSYEKENILDFKIKLDEENGTFDFYCKGYNRPGESYYGNRGTRSVIGKLGLNFVLAQCLAEGEDWNKLPENSIDSEITQDNYYKIELEETNESQGKNLKIPAEKWKDLKKVYEKFMEQENVWSRPLKSIKVPSNSFYKDDIWDTPAIYLSSKGKCYMVISILPPVTDTNNKIKKPGTTFKGVELSFKEVTEMFANHPWAEKIKAKSIEITSKAYLTSNNDEVHFGNISSEEKQKTFDIAFFNCKLQSELGEKPKAKKFKI